MKGYDASTSFPGNTSILTPEGVRPIQTIKVGDSIVSYNLETRKREITTVTNIIARTDENFIQINGDLKATGKHPLAVIDGAGVISWKSAEAIVPGDCLFAEGSCISVREVTKIQTDPQRVYNMHVTGPENYFVFIGSVPVLVHNKQLVL